MAQKKQFNWVKWLLLLILLAGAGGGAYWYFQREKDPPVDFKTAAVARGDLTQTVTANGQITPVKNVQVGSQISGIIKEIRVDFNSQVSSNQVIAQIDPSTYQQNVDQAEAELFNAKAGLELAELNYHRAQSLRSNALISVSDADKALADLHQAQAVVRMREASLKKTKVDLERTTIYAPISGVVITRNVDVGQTVAASFSTPTLFLIANDLSKMEINAMVSEADVGGVQEDQPATFTVEAFPNRQFEGKVQQVRFAPTTNQNVVTYTTVVGVSNDDLKLRPGMTANLSIVVAQKKDVLKIPNAALRARPPENSIIKPATNAVRAVSGNAQSSSNGAARPMGRGQGEGLAGSPGDSSSVSREDRRRRFESMTPEQQAAFRERRGRMGEGGGGFGRGGGPPGAARGQLETPGPRTVYLLVKTNSPSGKEIQMAKPITIKTGISDAISTEVLEGLNEGDLVITGSNLPNPVAAATPQGASPFGQPFGRGFRPR